MQPSSVSFCLWRNNSVSAAPALRSWGVRASGVYRICCSTETERPTKTDTWFRKLGFLGLCHSDSSVKLQALVFFTPADAVSLGVISSLTLDNVRPNSLGDCKLPCRSIVWKSMLRKRGRPTKPQQGNNVRDPSLTNATDKLYWTGCEKPKPR